MLTPVPNFFLVGPPKCGTTAIASNLARHPEIFVSDPKEPNYFFYEGGNPYNFEPEGGDSFQSYQDLFSSRGNEIAVGDASTWYFFGRHVPKEIHKFNPKAKIIAVMRNPIYRALSMYRFWYARHAHQTSMEEFIDCFVNEKLVSPAGQQSCRVEWLKDIGFYSRHLSRYREFFPDTQIKVIFYEDLLKRTDEVFADMFSYLQVKPVSAGMLSNELVNRTYQPRWVWLQSFLLAANEDSLAFMKQTPVYGSLANLKRKIEALNRSFKNKLLAQLTPEIYGKLIQTYLADIEKLEEMTGRNLSGWRDGSMA